MALPSYSGVRLHVALATLFPPDRAPLAWAPVYYLRPLWGRSIVLLGWCGSFRGMCALVSPVVLALAHGVVGVWPCLCIVAAATASERP